MTTKEKDCPLTISDWIDYLQDFKSNITSITMHILQILIALLAIFVSIIYLAEIRDNIIKNLVAGQITISMSYFAILIIILILAVISSILIIFFARNYMIDVEPVNELLKKIVDGEDDSNNIRKEWREKLDKAKEKKKMFNNKRLKLTLKHWSSVIWLIIMVLIFVLIGSYVVRDDKIIYAIIIQIFGVLLLSFWSLLEKSTKALKIIANFMNKIIRLEGNPWKQFDKMCRTTGLGLVMAGLIVELINIS